MMESDFIQIEKKSEKRIFSFRKKEFVLLESKNMREKNRRKKKILFGFEKRIICLIIFLSQ